MSSDEVDILASRGHVLHSNGMQVHVHLYVYVHIFNHAVHAVHLCVCMRMCGGVHVLVYI